MKKIRYGIIGIGRMGGIHAINLLKGRDKNGTLVAVCDIDEAVLNEFSKKYPEISTFKDYNEMFKGINLDAVIVATPHYSHVDIVIDALKANINVLSEKPQAVTVGEAQRAINEAKLHKNLKYAIMYNQRTNRMYKFAKKLVENGAIGQLKRVSIIIAEWYRSQAYYNQGGWRASWSGEGGGLLINQCVHQLDIFTWLLGMPLAIRAWTATKNRNITVENDITAVFSMENNVKATFTALGHELKGDTLWEIVGDKGKIVINKFRMKFIKFKESETEVNKKTTAGYGFTKSKTKRYSYGFKNLTSDMRVGQQIRIIRNFSSSLLNKEELIANGEEGIKALSIINAIYLSSFKNEEVKLPLDEKEIDSLNKKLIELEEKGEI